MSLPLLDRKSLKIGTINLTNYSTFGISRSLEILLGTVHGATPRACLTRFLWGVRATVLMRTYEFGVPSLITGQLSEHLRLFSRFVFVPSQRTPVSSMWICEKHDLDDPRRNVPSRSTQRCPYGFAAPRHQNYLRFLLYVNYCKMGLDCNSRDGWRCYRHESKV